MTIIVADDFTLVDNADANGNWLEHTLFGGNMASPAVDPNVKAQGTGSIGLGVNGTGVAGFAVDTVTARNIRDKHVFIWAFTMQSFLDDIANGAMICYSSATDGSSNVGCITVGGQDTNIGNNKNFQRWCVDPSQPFNVHVNGAPPAESSINSLCMLWDITSSNGRVSAFCDQVVFGTKTTVTGGTAVSPGDSLLLAANDKTNSRGMFQDIGGIYYILGCMEFGDVGAAGVSHFVDSGKVWNFDGQHVSAAFHRMLFVGNATGINAATFGTEVGTGITANGSGGNVFQAGGDVPFRLEAIDSNITTHLFGCTMINAIALLEDPWRRVFTVDTPAAAFDDTRDANDVGANDVFPFPVTPVVNDYIAFGHAERFNHATINIGTAGTGAYGVTWEYSTGTSTWAALTDVTDGTGAFKTAGSNTVTFAIPDDWVKGTVGGASMYYIRAKHSGGGQTIRPQITQSSAGMGGGMRAENANFKAVSGTWTNMDTIRCRNGAILRKLTLVNSVSSVKSAQLDMGSSDPALDTVRDLTIIGANNGILLKGTSTGTTTYNFRNIKFSGNVNDVRVDFPAVATIVINILEGGSSPTVQNVNGSTVTINNAVNVKVAGITEGTPVKIIANETVGTITNGDVLQDALADDNGETNLSFNYEGAFDPSGLDVRIVARNQGVAAACIADDGGVFTDETLAGVSNASADMTLLPVVPIVGDSYRFGHDEEFTGLKLAVSTALAGTGNSIVWEYWNGTVWTSLAGVVDGTNGLTTTGENFVGWALPSDWATRTDNIQGPFKYVRARLSATTTVTSVPVGGKVTLDVTRYLPYDVIRTILSTGLTDTASWTEDKISTFNSAV